MKKTFLLCLLTIVFTAGSAAAQSLSKDSMSLASAIHNSLKVYHSALYPQTSLYNGSRYAFFPFEFKEGQPFLETSNKDSNYIIVDFVKYDSIAFLYDLVRQKIVVNNPSGDAIFLHDEKVNGFYQNGYKFIRINKDTANLSTGFYAQLHTGRVTLLQKRDKTIRSTVTSDGEQRFVEEKIKYFIRKNSTYLSADGKKAVLNIFPEHRSDLQQYIRQEKLSFKKAFIEKSLVRLLQYYEKIAQ